MEAVGVTHSESMQAPHMCCGRKQNVKVPRVVGRAWYYELQMEAH